MGAGNNKEQPDPVASPESSSPASFTSTELSHDLYNTLLNAEKSSNQVSNVSDRSLPEELQNIISQASVSLGELVESPEIQSLKANFVDSRNQNKAITEEVQSLHQANSQAMKKHALTSPKRCCPEEFTRLLQCSQSNDQAISCKDFLRDYENCVNSVLKLNE